MALIEILFRTPSNSRSFGARLVAAVAALSILSDGPALGADWATAAEFKEPILDCVTRVEKFEQHRAMKEESPFKKAKWSYLGPTNISGR